MTFVPSLQINLLNTLGGAYMQGIAQLRAALAAGINPPFQPDTFLDQARSLQHLLEGRGEPAPRLTGMVARMEDLAGDCQLTMDQARFLLDQARAGESSLIPGYRYLQRIGRGLVGTVYRGLEEKSGRVVAIKVGLLGPTSGPEGRAKKTRKLQRTYKNEWEMMLTVASERTVRPLSRGKIESGKPFLVMEYLAGGSLRERIALVEGGQAPFDLKQAIDWALQAAEAVAVVHERGVIHNDVKPSSFLLTSEGIIKLGDFSFATTVHRGRVHGPIDSRGTEGYLPLETVETPRKDVYALGVTLFLLFSGQMPRRNVDHPLFALLSPPPSVRNLRPERQIPEPIDRVIRRAIMEAPTARYPDAIAMARALSRAIATSRRSGR